MEPGAHTPEERIAELEAARETTERHLADALNQFQAVSLQLADITNLVHGLTSDLGVFRTELLRLDRRMTQAGLPETKKTCPEHGRALPCPCGRR